jgi:hypothetical protein
VFILSFDPCLVTITWSRLFLVDFMVVDMDPRQQTSIILGKPILKLVRAIIDKSRGTTNMKVVGVLEKFIYYPRTLHAVARFKSTDTLARGR